jgi:hypothetical protein
MLAGAIETMAHRLEGAESDFDPLITAARDAEVVLLGESTHGTHEFYAARADITMRLIREAGFDGIQWDYESCPDGDRSFLALLEETRSALPPGTLLSAAVPVWMPPPLSSIGWTEDYFGQVSKRCDQLAVMCYDTGFFLPRSYVWLVSQQVIRVTRAVGSANPACRVIFGLPTYDEGAWSHWSHAESLAMGLRGVQDGIESGRADMRVFAGIAPFADYTTSEGEWRLLQKVWPAAGR